MHIGLRIDLEEIDRKVVLRLDGRLDAATSPILEKKINSLLVEDYSLLLLDFVCVDYLSSAGMRLLLAASKKLKQKQGALVLFAVGEEVMKMIKLAGFDKILHIFETEQDALQYMS
jgi:anti-anti-sigma factor